MKYRIKYISPDGLVEWYLGQFDLWNYRHKSADKALPFATEADARVAAELFLHPDETYEIERIV